MKTGYKAKKVAKCIILCGVVMSVMSVFFAPCPVFCLEKMDGKSLKAEKGQAGLASFSQSDNTIRMFMDIHLETYTEIDSMKIGYYDNGSGPGWDQDWRNVKIGTSVTDPMLMDGFVFKADFNDLQTASRPTLKRLVIGTNRLAGTMSADIASFTGVYNPAINASGAHGGTALTRENLGNTAFNFVSPESETDKSLNQGFFIVITPEGDHPGIQVVAGYNELNISSSPFSQGEWWDK